MIPRVGPTPDPHQTYTLRPGAYAILPLKGAFLLTEEYEGTPEIQLPGGGIDPGESPTQALHREVMEETGWTIAHPKRIGAFRRFVFMPEYDLWAEKLCSVYVARPCRQLCDPIEPFHRTVWASGPEAVNALGNAGDQRYLIHYLNSC